MGGEATNHSGLEGRFLELLRRLDLEPHAGSVFRLVAEHYSEPGRHYHTLEHIGYCLHRLDDVRHLLRDADAAELALWFHDTVYDPSRDDNELRSAFFSTAASGFTCPRNGPTISMP